MHYERISVALCSSFLESKVGKRSSLNSHRIPRHSKENVSPLIKKVIESSCQLTVASRGRKMVRNSPGEDSQPNPSVIHIASGSFGPTLVSLQTTPQIVEDMRIAKHL